ncbi:MAG: 5'-nucleotidase C-terminal domain-containing protein [Saprospiraceae bacterium]|nr:5'-nucleotidase C-terminal domain-containing protein [Saprospiraceae bacterium]
MTRWSAAILIIIVCIGVSCSSVNHLAGEHARSYQITDTTSPAIEGSRLEKVITPYREKLSAEMNEVIGLAASSLEKGTGESTLGNWVADAVLSQAELISHKFFDFAICNSGGLRIPSLPAGPITRGQIFELMPFDNYLVTMKVPGTVIAQLFDHMAESNGWPISEGVSYEIKDQKAQKIMIKNQLLNLDETYEFVLSDYLAEGGSNLDFLKAYPYKNLNIYYRDAIIEFALLKHVASISIDARIEGRIVLMDK